MPCDHLFHPRAGDLAPDHPRPRLADVMAHRVRAVRPVHRLVAELRDGRNRVDQSTSDRPESG